MKSLHTILSILFIFWASTFLLGQQAGRTMDNFVVDENGAARYSIPITISPGTRAMAPNLSFSYVETLC